MRALGFDATSIAPEIEAIRSEEWRARNPAAAAASSLATFLARAEHDARDLEQAIEETEPEALLVDTVTWGAHGVAEASGLPWGSYCPMPLPLPSRDAPAFGPGLRPPRGRLGRGRDRLLRAAMGVGFGRYVGPRLNELRADLGLMPIRRPFDLIGRSPLLLYMSSASFDYPRSDWPEHVVAVGPCAWDPPGGLPAELAAVEAPFVLVTTSTDFQDDSALARNAFRALLDEPVHVIATLPTAEVSRLSPPENASALPFISHGPVLARSACAITHGGMGATQKALSYGVPVCAVPFGRDQFEVARRVEVAGVGSRLPARRLRPDRLRAQVREAISLRAGAERIARAFAAEDGIRRGVDAFERRLLGRSPKP